MESIILYFFFIVDNNKILIYKYIANMFAKEKKHKIC